MAIAPDGVAVVIETKTMTYERRTSPFCTTRRRGSLDAGEGGHAGAPLASTCLVRARGVERVEHDVLVVSIDRLTDVLRVAAGMGPDARSAG